MKPLAVLTAVLSLLPTVVSAQPTAVLASSPSLNFYYSGAATPPAQTITVSSTGPSLPFTVTVQAFGGSANWLTASLTQGVTPAALTIGVNAAFLPSGIYKGRVGLTATTAQPALIDVTLTVGASPAAAALTASPTSLNLSAQGGPGAPASDSFIVSSSGIAPGNFTLTTSTSSGGPWLSATPTSGSLPAAIAVTANAFSLQDGTYSGTVSVTADSGATLNFPVSFTVGSGGSSSAGLAISQPSLSFAYQIGGSSPPPMQTLQVTNSTGSVPFTATSTASWLLLTTAGNLTMPTATATGTTDGALNFTINPTGLAPGNYTTSVAITTGSQTLQVSVTLTAGTSPILSAQPAALTFSAQVGDTSETPQSIALTSSGGAINYAASSGSPWLAVSPQSGSTPGSLSVSVNPTGLAAGSYSGSIAVNGLTIPITLKVGGSSSGNVSFAPASVSFQVAPGSAPATQKVALTSSSGTVTFSLSASSDGNWLTATSAGSTTPAAVTLTANPMAVAAQGTYTGMVSVTTYPDGNQTNLNVTLTVGNGGSLSVTPAMLSLAANDTQTLQIASSAGTSAFTVSPSAPWLNVNPVSGVTPATLTVTTGNLPAGTYQASIAVSGGGASVNVPVTLTAGGAGPSVSVSPLSLTFNANLGGSDPAPQSVATTGAAGFTATAAQSWLAVSPSSATAPATLTVIPTVAGLPPGIYSGSVTITPANGGPAQTVSVTLTVAAQPGASLISLVNGASQFSGPVAPGEVVTLKGNGFGSLATARVLFDDTPAPLLSVRADRINAVVPYGVAGRASTQVTVEVGGVRTPALSVAVADSAPGIFTADGSGQGAGDIVNADGTLNGPGSAAAAGSVVIVYATGEGQTSPMGVDGRVITTDLRTPLLPVSATIGGLPAVVTYAGSAPGSVSGMLQVNLQVPNGLAPGPQPIAIQVGNAVSQAGVTICVH
jgi:uncharacterized protein (TIGR03437 family)